MEAQGAYLRGKNILTVTNHVNGNKVTKSYEFNHGQPGTIAFHSNGEVGNHFVYPPLPPEEEMMEVPVEEGCLTFQDCWLEYAETYGVFTIVLLLLIVLWRVKSVKIIERPVVVEGGYRPVIGGATYRPTRYDF